MAAAAAAAAPAAVTAVTSLVTGITNIVSQIDKNLVQVKVNGVKVAELRVTAASIKKSLDEYGEKIDEFGRYHSQMDVTTLRKECEIIHETVNLLNTHIIDVISPKRRRWHRSNSHKALLEHADEKLKEIEKKIGHVKEELDKQVQSTHTTVTLGRKRNGPPHAVDWVAAESRGKKVVIQWKDSKNKPGSLKGYNISIDGKRWIYVNLPELTEETDNSDSTSRNDIQSIQVPYDLSLWKTYTIKIWAENDYLPSEEKKTMVRMNQNPPDIQPPTPTVNALSKTKVILAVPHPLNKPEEMEISKCEVQVFESYAGKPMAIECNVSTEFCTEEIWIHVNGLDPTVNYAMHVLYSNCHGGGPPSEPAKFKIESLEPSEPILEIKEISYTADSVILGWQTNSNAGCIEHYELYDGHNTTPLQSTSELCHTVEDLKVNTEYSFKVAAAFQKTGNGSYRYKYSNSVPFELPSSVV